MRRPLSVLALSHPHGADAAAQVGIGAPAVAGSVPVRDDRERVGRLLVERTGSDIIATATFRRRPPAKRATLCVTVAGDERCASERVVRGDAVVLERTGAFTSALTARIRCGGARAVLRL